MPFPGARPALCLPDLPPWGTCVLHRVELPLSPCLLRGRLETAGLLGARGEAAGRAGWAAQGPGLGAGETVAGRPSPPGRGSGKTQAPSLATCVRLQDRPPSRCHCRPIRLHPLAWGSAPSCRCRQAGDGPYPRHGSAEPSRACLPCSGGRPLGPGSDRQIGRALCRRPS